MAGEQTSRAPTLSALLPIKLRGRHYGDNLARVDLLFSSLLHFGACSVIGDLVVVVRGDEADLIARHLTRWPELPLRIVVEDDYFPAFRRFTKPWQVRPWQRQQIIKLNAAAFTGASFVLILDPDVLTVKPLAKSFLLPSGRAVLEPEPRSVHPQWWTASAELLGVDPSLGQMGTGVTPAILSTAILAEVQERLQATSGRPWMDTLLTSYCEWTEFTLYLLAAQRAELLDRYHVWADDPGVPHHLQVDTATSVWEAAANAPEAVERMFTTSDPGLFAVIQGNSVPVGDVAHVVARYCRYGRIPPRPSRRTG